MKYRAWFFVVGALALGALASGGCSNSSGSQGIPCAGPEHCSAYGLVCSTTLKLCVACNTSSDCPNGGACVNAACQTGAGNGGSFSTGGQGGSSAGSIGSGGSSAGSIGSGGSSAGSIGNGGVSGSIGSGGTLSDGGTIGVSGSSGSGGAAPICDSTTPNGVGECCPEAAYPWWCWHGYPDVGHCFAYGVDCATVTVCSPETFARACPASDFVTCEICGANYGHCYYAEPCL